MTKKEKAFLREEISDKAYYYNAIKRDGNSTLALLCEEKLYTLIGLSNRFEYFVDIERDSKELFKKICFEKKEDGSYRYIYTFA